MSSTTALTRPTTLVLRKDCDRPLALWPLKDMVWSGQTVVLALHTGLIEPVLFGKNPQQVRSPSVTMQLPLVARLTEYIAPKFLKKRTVPFNLSGLYVRELGRCAYCGCHTVKKPNQPDSATFDHVFPRSRGGKDCWGNAALSCMKCNAKKGALTPEEANMSLLIKPWEPTPAEMMKLYISLHPLDVPEWHDFMPLPETPRVENAFSLATQPI